MRRTDTSITLEQDADSSAPALFALLADPRSHVQMDASGMLQAAEDATIIDHVEQVFSMAMHYPSLGDYITDNRVIESNQTGASPGRPGGADSRPPECAGGGS